MLRLTPDRLPDDFKNARCWLDELENPPNYCREDLGGRGICTRCHVNLKDPAFQPPGSVNNNHRGCTLKQSHEPYCPGQCPGLHKCVLYKVYGRSFIAINNLRYTGINHGGEIKALVQQMRRREREERREEERGQREERRRAQEQDRLVASNRFQSMFDALQERVSSGDTSRSSRNPITREELHECLQVCRDLAVTYRDSGR